MAVFSRRSVLAGAALASLGALVACGPDHDEDDEDHALDGRTPDWTASFASSGVPSTKRTLLAGGQLLVGVEGLAYAYDPATGRKTWESPYGPITLDKAGGRWAATGGLVFTMRSAASGQQPQALATGPSPAPLPEVPTVYALDAATGALRWKYPCPGAAWVDGPYAADGVVAVNVAGAVAVVRATDGRPLWTTPISTLGVGGGLNAVIVGGGTTYVKATDRTLDAFDAVSGRPRWRIDTADGVPLAYGGGALYSVGDEKLVCWDASTGAQRWQAATAEFGSDVTPVLTVAGGRVVWSTYTVGASLIAHDVATGRKAWQVDLPGSPETAPVVVGDTVVVNCGKSLVAVGAKDGAERWTARHDHFAGLSGGAGRVFVLNSRTTFDPHTLYALPV